MTTNPDPNDPAVKDRIDRYDVPEELKSILLHYADGRDKAKWTIALSVADFIADIPNRWRSILRARVIQRCAPFAKVEISTLREMVHAAEIFTPKMIHEPKYARLSFSHFCRAARCGNRKAAKMILDQIVEESDQFTPTCARIDYLVALHAFAQSNGDEQGEELITKFEAHRSQNGNGRARLHGHVINIQLSGMSHKAIVLPDDAAEFSIDDEVLIIRHDKTTLEE